MTTILLNVNGTDYHISYPGSRTLLSVLRDDLRLTGPKAGCERGNCGSCTVHLDGAPALSCLTLAVQAEGRQVTTIEGVSADPLGSRLQAHFGRCIAGQCGACTPGMVLSGLALLRQNPHPTDAEVRRAIDGNLCRCTGYTAISVAVRETTGEDTGYAISSPNPGRFIGRPTTTLGAAGKTDGSALYVDDLHFEGELHGAILRSPHAHAEIVSMDTLAAQAMPGVHLVLTGADFPRRIGIFPYLRDERILAEGKVCYAGEGVAAVVADTLAIAQAACRAIKVVYKPLPFVLSARDALSEGAPTVHPVDYKGRPKSDNVANLAKTIHYGDVEGAFAKASVVVSGTWSHGGSTHAAIGRHGAIGTVESGRLTLYTSSQVTHALQREAEYALGLPEGSLHIIQPKVGGAFGGKSDPFPHEVMAVEAARRLERPVRFIIPREDVYALHRGRHPIEYELQMACDPDGNILGLKLAAWLSGGAQFSYGFVTRYYAISLLGPMKIGALKGDAVRAFTNTAPCGAKRGHGGPQLTFALQTALDEAAHALELDPIEIRRRVALRDGERNILGALYPTCGAIACLDAVEVASGWKKRRASLPRGRGIGIAYSSYISGTAKPVNAARDIVQTIVAVDVDDGGRFTVRTAVNEIGQGVDTVLALVAGEVLGVDPHLVTVKTGDTDLPKDVGAFSSRLTLMAGGACRSAAEAMKKRLALGERGPFTTLGQYVTEDLPMGDHESASIGLSPAYSTTAIVAEVDVDFETGKVRVTHLWVAHDCGRALNPVAVRGQIEGSVYMTWAEMFLESMDYHPATGAHVGPNLLDCPIPVASDTPEIHAILVETNDPKGPFGAKEAGEGPALPVTAAIANAIFHATGVRVRRVPVRPEELLEALDRVAKGETHVVLA